MAGLVHWLEECSLPAPEGRRMAQRLAYLRQQGLPVLAGFVLGPEIYDGLSERRGQGAAERTLKVGVTKEISQACERFFHQSFLVLAVDEQVRAQRVVSDLKMLEVSLRQLIEQFEADEVVTRPDLLFLSLPDKVEWSGTVTIEPDGVEVVVYRGYPALGAVPTPKRAMARVPLLNLTPKVMSEHQQRYALGLVHHQDQFRHIRPKQLEPPRHLFIQAAIVARQCVGMVPAETKFSWLAVQDDVFLVTEETDERQSLLLGVRIVVPGFQVGPVRLIRTVRDIQRIQPGEIIVTERLQSGLLKHLDEIGGVIVRSLAGSQTVVRSLELKNIPLLVWPDIQHLRTGQVLTMDALSGQLLVGRSERPTVLPARVPGHHTLPAVSLLLDDPKDAALAAQQPTAGVGLFRPEQMLLMFRDYPQLFSRTEQGRRRLSKEIEAQLRRLLDIFVGKRFIYQLADFEPGEEKRELPFGTNPFLLDHGARAMLADPTLLFIQLQGLLAVAEAVPERLEVALPFARSAEEVVALIRSLSEARLYEPDKLPLQLMVQAPGLAQEIRQLADCHLAGIRVDLRSVLRLLYAIETPSADEAERVGTANWFQLLAHEAEEADLPWAVVDESGLLTPELGAVVRSLGCSEFVVPVSELDEMLLFLESLHHLG